jgi:hypothetical protein
MFCCDGFKNLIGDAGQRGMSVLVYQTFSGEFRFALQSRAISMEAEILLTQTPTTLPIKGNMTISANIVLNYCPFCGSKLRRLVTRSTKKHFQALAAEHKSFYKPLS